MLAGLQEVLDDDSDPTRSALSAVASLAAAWPQLHQGCALKQLDLDSCTLSEILRLHILASGADWSHGNAKFFYQKQGGFTVMDDPCVELRLSEPALLKRLSYTPVYDLTAGEHPTDLIFCQYTSGECARTGQHVVFVKGVEI